MAFGSTRLVRQPGWQRLSPLLTINGIQKTAAVNIYGGDADASGDIRTRDPSHVTLLQTAPGPTYQVPIHTSRAIHYDGTGAHHSPVSATYGNVGTDDFVVELALVTPPIASADDFFNKRGRGPPFVGWATQVNIALVLEMRLDTGPVFRFFTAPLVADTLFHCIGFADRSGFGVWYIDSVQQMAVDISAAAATLDVAEVLSLGEGVSGVGYTGDITGARIWHEPAWLDTHLQAAVAQQRFDQFTGGARVTFQ